MSAHSLSPQERALCHVASLSSGAPLDPTLRVTLNFHPDRPVRGRPILLALAEAGLYQSQFLTGTSNGGLTAYVGGDRWRWESRIFGSAYNDAPEHERPVYGSLNFRHRSVGGSPRFGSAHFRLTTDTLNRATFCYPDSVLEPSAFGVAASMSLIEMAEAHDSDDALDDYIEAQVHGLVRLDRHAEALVLDPSHRGTAVEDAARGLRCPVEWHPGFRLTVDELRRHPDYRGPEYVDLGAEIAVDGRLDPRIIGDAARTGRYDPQALKRVWHYVARFGAPLQAAGDLSARAREGRHAASRDPDASQEGRVSFGRTYPLRSTGAPAERLTVRRPRAGTRHGAPPGADRGMRRSAVELRAPTTGRVRANCPR